MIEATSGRTRQALARSRCLAITGRVQEAEDTLSAAGFNDESLPAVDRGAMGLLLAEIAHWQQRDCDALAIYDASVEPHLSQLSEEHALIAGLNRCSLALSAFEENDFYHLSDLRRSLDLRLHHEEVYWSAQQATEANKHYEALPSLWRELQRTYLQGYWSAFYEASRLLSVECMALNFRSDAVYHAVMSCSVETGKRVGRWLLQHAREIDPTECIDKALECGMLNRHFFVSAALLAEMADAIPQGDIRRITTWLLRRATVTEHSRGGPFVMNTAWETLRCFAHRLTAEEAAELFSRAVSHDAWAWRPASKDNVCPLREEIVKALVPAAHRLTKARATSFAVDVLPLATERSSFVDYYDVVELLCQLSGRGGSKVSSLVRGALYSRAGGIPPILMQVADVFECPIDDGFELERHAAQVIAGLKRQVEEVPAKSAPSNVPGTLYTVGKNLGTVEKRVHAVDTVATIGVLRRFNQLKQKTQRELLEALLGMIEESDNLLSNRSSLVSALCEAAKWLGRKAAKGVLDRLEPLAIGRIRESSIAMSAADARHPLNPFRFHDRTLEVLRGVSLVAYARIAKAQSEVPRREFLEMVELGVRDPNPVVRRHALIAASEFPVSSTALSVAIVLASDRDAGVSEAAFYLLRHVDVASVGDGEWISIVHTLRQASRSDEVALRRSAARCITALSVQEGDSASDLEDMRRRLAADSCFSVREAATLKKSAR